MAHRISKVILITGTARIGSDVAVGLSGPGIGIGLTYRKSRSKAEKTKKAIEGKGGVAEIFQGDLSQESHAKKCLSGFIKKFGQLDVLVNMASDYEKTPWARVSGKQYEALWHSNLSSAFFMSLAAAPFLKKTGGRIINFSDWVVSSDRPAYRGFLPYYVAKKGVQGLTEAMALELAPDVLVNCIAPGPILPPQKLTNDEVKDIGRVTPLKRWGGSGEILKTVRFLIETQFVTGETIRVDGGRHLQ